MSESCVAEDLIEDGALHLGGTAGCKRTEIILHSVPYSYAPPPPPPPPVGRRGGLSSDRLGLGLKKTRSDLTQSPNAVSPGGAFLHFHHLNLDPDELSHITATSVTLIFAVLFLFGFNNRFFFFLNPEWTVHHGGSRLMAHAT